MPTFFHWLGKGWKLYYSLPLTLPSLIPYLTTWFLPHCVWNGAPSPLLYIKWKLIWRTAKKSTVPMANAMSEVPLESGVLWKLITQAAGWVKGFVTCFLGVPQAAGLNCSCHAAQASKGNSLSQYSPNTLPILFPILFQFTGLGKILLKCI